MKVCLFSLTVGEGLHKICHAIENELTAIGVEAETIDTYKNHPQLQKQVSENYYTMVKYIPRVARTVQHWKQNYNRKLKNKETGFVYSKSEVGPLRELIIEKYRQEKFEVLYSPVSIIAGVACVLKKEGLISCKVVYQIPDFNIPVYVENMRNIDAVIASCEENKQTFLQAGFSENQMQLCRIPVDTKFLQQLDKNETRKNLNLPQDQFICLIMTGGYGFGKTHKLIEKLVKYAPDIHYVVINGRNVQEKELIDTYIAKNNLKNVTNLGFCTIVDQYMSASDCIYTKLGAATMCETAAKNLIMLTNKQLLYPEYDNMLHLQKHHGLLVCKNEKELAKNLQKLRQDPNFANEIRKAFQAQFNLHAATDIANLLKKLCNSSKNMS